MEERDQTKEKIWQWCARTCLSVHATALVDTVHILRVKFTNLCISWNG